MKRILLLITSVSTMLVGHIRADVWDFEYTGAGVTASGLLFTGAYDAGYNGYEITGITGTRNGVGIDGLVPNPAFPGSSNTAVGPANWYITYDNLLTTAPGFTTPGLYYTSGGVNYNVYLNGIYYELTLDQANNPGGNPGTALRTLTITQHVPDGGLTVALLGGALCGLAIFRRRFAR